MYISYKHYVLISFFYHKISLSIFHSFTLQFFPYKAMLHITIMNNFISHTNFFDWFESKTGCTFKKGNLRAKDKIIIVQFKQFSDISFVDILFQHDGTPVHYTLIQNLSIVYYYLFFWRIVNSHLFRNEPQNLEELRKRIRPSIKQTEPNVDTRKTQIVQRKHFEWTLGRLISY